MTVHDCLTASVAILTNAGFMPEDARRDAAVLSRHVLGWTTADWAARIHSDAPVQFAEHVNALAWRRASREPIAYITETREFYGRPFRVTPDVLIPRPETEAIVEEVLRLFDSGSSGSSGSPLVIDVGTGSGCIAITLALEWPAARVIATDVSSAALTVASANARTLCADVEFAQVSGTAFSPPELPPADVIVSNPPYVAECDRLSLAPDVRDFEPASALFGGPDGLDVIRGLLPAAALALASGGFFVMEMGIGQSSAVTELAENAGLHVERIVPDLQGIPRLLIARRRPA